MQQCNSPETMQLCETLKDVAINSEKETGRATQMEHCNFSCSCTPLYRIVVKFTGTLGNTHLYQPEVSTRLGMGDSGHMALSSISLQLHTLLPPYFFDIKNIRLYEANDVMTSSFLPKFVPSLK